MTDITGDTNAEQGTAEAPITVDASPVIAAEAQITVETQQPDEAAPSPVVEPIAVAETAVVAAAVDEKKTVEKDTRSEIHRLWDEAEADVEKGLDWFRAEIAKL